MPTIKVIPSTINEITHLPASELKKRRVCAYARVSTDSDEQFTSYQAQIDYYTRYIANHSEWEYVNVYADEGISGTNTKNRKGFQEMLKDAFEGKIDLIITKSISRFARNTVDTLVNIRKLKEHGVECFFEKENIYTFDSKGELLLTIMSSLAQEESRSISQNVTWGIRKAFSDGKVLLAYGSFLGFKEGPNGRPEVVPEEAETIRLIYSSFLKGNTYREIAALLQEKGTKTPQNKNKKEQGTWRISTVQSILTNEKYRGDARLQKTFTTDYLTHEHKVNNGEVPQYYVEKSHEAIIQPEDWDLVQMEIQRRKELGKHFSGGMFSSRLICGDCGGIYGQKVWHSNDKYCKKVFRCNMMFENHSKCQTPILDERAIKKAFLEAFNSMSPYSEKFIADCQKAHDTLFDTSDIEKKLEEIGVEIEAIAESVRALVKNNVSSPISQDEYNKRYKILEKKFNGLKEQDDSLKAKRADLLKRKSALAVTIAEFKKAPKVMEAYDEELWNMLLDKAIVRSKNSIEFHFKNGVQKTIEIQ